MRRERKRNEQNRKAYYLQESKLKVTMDLCFESDLNVEVEVESQPQSVALAAALLLVVDGIASYAAQGARRAVDEAACRVLDVTEGEIVKRALLLTLAASSLRGSIVL